MGGMGGEGSGSGWGGVRVDVNEELKFLRKFKKKIFLGCGRGVRGGQWEGSGWGGGQGERSIEVFVKITKKKKFWGGGGGGGGRVGGVRMDVN